MWFQHHCRACGFIFCNSCSPKKISLPTKGWAKAVRACQSCYDEEVRRKTFEEKLLKMLIKGEEFAQPKRTVALSEDMSTLMWSGDAEGKHEKGVCLLSEIKEVRLCI